MIKSPGVHGREGHPNSGMLQHASCHAMPDTIAWSRAMAKS